MQAASVYHETNINSQYRQEGSLRGSPQGSAPSGVHGSQPIVGILRLSSTVSNFMKYLGNSSGWFIEEYDTVENFETHDDLAPLCIVANVSMLNIEIETISNFLEIHSTSVVFVDDNGKVLMTLGTMKPKTDSFVAEFGGVDLVNAVRKAINRGVSSSQSQELHRSLQIRYGSLSRREQEVMLLVTKGLLNKQVAHELKISEVTVKVHRGRMMRKMGARSLADLVRMADDLDLPGRESAA